MRTTNKIIIVGFGSIAQALLPLLKEHYDAEIIIFDKETDKARIDISNEYGAILHKILITPDNYDTILAPLLNNSCFLLNLAVSVSTQALIDIAQKHDALYLDTCIEPWDYGDSPENYASNHSLRESLKKYAADRTGQTTTAIVAHGANPGFISILLKKAMLEMANINGLDDQPVVQSEWAALAEKLGLQTIQISERDTQVSSMPRKNRAFICTWSVDGFITECLQPAELGWGSHENSIPLGARINGSSLELFEQGREVTVKSWSPNYLEFHAFLLTHNESLSIAEYLTVGVKEAPQYRPTVYYAYHPCDQTVDSMHLLNDGNDRQIITKHILKDSITSGIDELGIFLISTKYKSLWLGSNLSIGKAKKMAKYNSATSLQVVSSVVAGMKWSEQHPARGIIESESLDWKDIYDFAERYWQPIVKQETDWRPTPSSNKLSFENFRLKPHA